MFTRLLQNTLGYEPHPEPKPLQDPHPELLPAEMVGQILELEMESQQTSASKELISQLVSLYTAAVEYYENKGSPKYVIYKKRMHQFLSKHSIESLLEGKKPTMIARRQVIERNRQHATYGTKQQVQRIIDSSQKKVQNTKKLLHQQLNSQQKTLQTRIQRRKSMSNRSTRSDNQDLEDMTQELSNLLSSNYAAYGLKEKNAKKVFI